MFFFILFETSSTPFYNLSENRYFESNVLYYLSWSTGKSIVFFFVVEGKEGKKSSVRPKYAHGRSEQMARGNEGENIILLLHCQQTIIRLFENDKYFLFDIVQNMTKKSSVICYIRRAEILISSVRNVVPLNIFCFINFSVHFTSFILIKIW